MLKSFFTAKRCARAGVIAALYALLTVALQPFSFGIFQFRVSEALTVLPAIFPEAIPALFIGCLIANILGNGIYDIFIGSFATLVAALLTYFVSKAIKNIHLKLFVSAIFPVLCNAIAVPIIFILCGIATHTYIIEVLIIGAEEAGVVYTFGTALYYSIVKIMSILTGAETKKAPTRSTEIRAQSTKNPQIIPKPTTKTDKSLTFRRFYVMIFHDMNNAAF